MSSIKKEQLNSKTINQAAEMFAQIVSALIDDKAKKLREKDPLSK